jgi:hypothetical protein
MFFRKDGEILLDYTESPLWESQRVNKIDEIKEHEMDETYPMQAEKYARAKNRNPVTNMFYC